MRDLAIIAGLACKWGRTGTDGRARGRGDTQPTVIIQCVRQLAYPFVQSIFRTTRICNLYFQLIYFLQFSCPNHSLIKVIWFVYEIGVLFLFVWAFGNSEKKPGASAPASFQPAAIHRRTVFQRKKNSETDRFGFFFLRISSPYNICCWYKTVNMCGTQPTLYKTARSRRTNKSIHNTSQSHFPRDTVAEIAMCFALMMLNAYAHAWPEYSRRWISYARRTINLGP
jgi:hypothetical protein